MRNTCNVRTSYTRYNCLPRLCFTSLQKTKFGGIGHHISNAHHSDMQENVCPLQPFDEYSHFPQFSPLPNSYITNIDR